MKKGNKYGDRNVDTDAYWQQWQGSYVQDMDPGSAGTRLQSYYQDEDSYEEEDSYLPEDYEI